jgi:hypothetical protein
MRIRSASRNSPLIDCRWPTRPRPYEVFQNKEDGAIKIMLKPWG